MHTRMHSTGNIDAYALYREHRTLAEPYRFEEPVPRTCGQGENTRQGWWRSDAADMGRTKAHTRAHVGLLQVQSALGFEANAEVHA